MPVQTFLPDWVPAWVQLVVLILGILFLLAFLMMPFSVFGVKARLEALEIRLDEIQGEIRSLALRLPEAERGWEEQRPPMRAPPEPEPPARRPPIPPAAWTPDGVVRRPIGAASSAARPEEPPRRTEPRLR